MQEYGSYHDRKKSRVEDYNRNILGWKTRECAACSGSGRYDTTGSPKCGACNGTGKEKYNPTKENP